MKRILIVNVNWLGDAVLTLPVFKALKEKDPDSYLAVMTVARIKDLYRCVPWIDEIIVFDEKKEKYRPLNIAKLIIFLKNKKFDTAFFIHRSLTRILLCFLAGIPQRIGYKRTKTSLLLSTCYEPPAHALHRQDYYLGLFTSNGLIIKDKIPRILPPREKVDRYKAFVEKLKSKYSYIVGVSPSANWNLKLWPADNFSVLIDRLYEELNSAVVVFGAAGDCSIARAVGEGCKKKIYNFCGRTELDEMIALLYLTDLFISADSGPAHVAAALDKPAIVIFGPTSEEITAPRSRKTQTVRKHYNCPLPCYKLDCPDNICMKKVTVEDILSKVKEMINHA